MTDNGTLQSAVDAYTSSWDHAVESTVRAAAGRVPVFERRLRDAGLTPADLTGTDPLSQLPVLSKDDLPALQAADPPFGGLLASGAAVRRVFSSPGPINEPQLAGPDPWRWRASLQAAGFDSTDTVLNCFSYHLSPAGAMFDEAATALGAVVVPGGVGSQDIQTQAIANLDVTAYVGMPTYLAALVDRYAEAGHDPERWRLTKAVVSAEPLPESLRARLTRVVPVVRMAYGTAEVGLIAYEADEAGGGLTLGPDLVIQVCDLETGRPLTDATEGEVVVSLLQSEYPLLRFGTGDVSRWTLGPDGSLRLAGVLGRVGAAVKVRGMFVHPHQARVALDGTAGIDRYRLVVERPGDKDELRCELVLATGGSAGDVSEAARQRIRDTLRLSCTIRIVDQLPGDAPILVDNRAW